MGSSNQIEGKVLQSRGYILFLFGLIVGVAISSVLFFAPHRSSAHPGRTASDGCHYCRTNCDSWGVEWNERHCHGGTDSQPQSLPPQPPDSNLELPASPSPVSAVTVTPTQIFSKQSQPVSENRSNNVVGSLMIVGGSGLALGYWIAHRKS